MTFKHLNMNLKTLLILSTLFILTSQRTVYGQELDTICLPVSDVKILAAESEKYYLCDSLNRINEEEIKLLRQVIEEKQTQENLHQGVLSQARNEVTKLRRQRTLLSVGLGGSLTCIIVLLVP
jgi:cob(I)alamin adenosyltransferase